MAVNPAIALGVKGIEIDDPLNQYSKVMAIQSAQRQNALAQRQMQQAEQEQQAVNALNRAYAEAYNPQTGDVDINRLRQSMATGGYGSNIPKVEKSIYQGREARAKVDAENVKLLDSKLKQSRQFLEGINPNDPGAAQAYIAWHEANHADPVIGPALAARGVTADQARANITQALQTPGGLAKLIAESKSGAEKFIELNKSQLSTTDIGGQVVTRTFEPVTGQLTVVGTQRKTMTPGEAQRLDVDRERLGLEGRRVQLAEQAAASKTGEPGVQLSRQDIQAREKSYPKATAALKGFEAQADEFASDLERLKNHPGLSAITGVVAGRTPALTADGRAALALYNKIVAKGGFSALQDLRNSSPTGGGLGSISNQEGRELKASFSEIDRTLDAPDLRSAIDRTIAKIQGSKQRLREAHDLTYEYRNPAGSAEPAIPARPAPNNDAIQALRAGQGTPEQFDAIFGAGAAARALRGK